MLARVNTAGQQSLVIVVGPSGVGKSTFVERIVGDLDNLYDVVTCTTRPPRQGEQEGEPYFFMSEDEFRRRINKGLFIEWAKVYDYMYGVLASEIEQAWSKALNVVMDVDVQGARTVKSKYPQALSVFITPPSVELLKHRILERGGHPPSDLDLRLQTAAKEIAQAPQFDACVVNDDLEKAYPQFKKIVEKYLKKE